MFGRTKRQAKKRLASAGTFLEWLSAARELDNLVGTTEWINEDDSPLYEKDLLIDLVISLERLRKENRIPELIKTLEDGLYRHHHDCINPSLYQETYSGESKVLPRRVLSEAAKTLNFLCDIPSSLYSDEAKLVQFKKSAKTFGRSALMLSGGATMGIYHLGVVKALHDADLLPRVISGSSMGAIVAAGICTRKRSQLDEFFRDPEQIHRTAMRFNSPGKILREGALFDPQMLLEHIRANLGGDFTFEEAYNISGLILNISVSPTRSRQKPKILNYLSSPNLLVTQSTMVSCAMPLLFRPGMLMARGAQGTPEPYLPTERWVDGTLGGDLPMARVSRLHNVNHYIVSQTNPHIYPLLSKSDEPS
ncbi:DUF3336 domain-containing protein, partial [Myxococcota bacterium]|nr:DUF3336 domain-containing protein [Myxococcota bacterium]